MLMTSLVRPKVGVHRRVPAVRRRGVGLSTRCAAYCRNVSALHDQLGLTGDSLELADCSHGGRAQPIFETGNDLRSGRGIMKLEVHIHNPTSFNS